MPANPNANVTSFSCSITDSPPLPDGPVTLCAISADGSIPDNALSSNQAQTSDKASLSLSQCGYIRVDRTAPGVSFTAPAEAKVGDLINVSGTVTDAGSGASGAIAWTWGDNTAAGAGVATTHTHPCLGPTRSPCRQVTRSATPTRRPSRSRSPRRRHRAAELLAAELLAAGLLESARRRAEEEPSRRRRA